MATAYMYLKQTPRARNQLKRIAKMNWTMEVHFPFSFNEPIDRLQSTPFWLIFQTHGNPKVSILSF